MILNNYLTWSRLLQSTDNLSQMLLHYNWKLLSLNFIPVKVLQYWNIQKGAFLLLLSALL